MPQPEPTDADRQRAQFALYPIHRTVDISYEELNDESRRTVDKVARLIAEVQEECLVEAAETLDHRVLHAWAEAGDDPRGRGYAMGLSVAAAAVGRPDEIWASPERAENVKAEIERLRDERSAIERIRELHRPYRIYDSCDHRHTEEDRAAGRAQAIEDMGLVCEDGLLYVICHECCTEGSGYQSESCATNHEHGADMPICSTIAALESSYAPVNQ